MLEQEPGDWTPVRTPRLLLCRPEARDEAAAIDLHTDPRTNVHHPVPSSVTRASSSRTFHEIRQHWYRHGFGVWAVFPADEPGRLIGFTGVSRRVVRGRPALNLYYRYSPEVWGQGLATEGALEAVRLAEQLLPGLPVVAYTSVDNIGSQRTALAAGLERREDLDVDRGAYLDLYLAKGW